MRVDRLFLKNYRCFKSLEVNFQRAPGSDGGNLHVLLAPNMVGKSAVLRALRIVLGTPLQKLKVNAAPSKSLNINTEEHRVIGSNPFSDKAREVTVEAKCVYKKWNNEWFESSYTFRKYKEDYAERNTKTQHIDGNIVKDANSSFNRVVELGDGVLPLILYVGTEYIHQQKALIETFTHDGSAKQGYLYCLDDRSMESYVFDWFKRLYKTKIEQERSDLARELYQSIAENTLATFRHAVRTILPDVVDVDWVQNTASKKSGEFFLVFNIRDQGVRTYQMLSDGYKYLVLLVGELVARATLLNKHLAENVLQCIDGVVLIDEFGIHLHPSLQADALSRLANLMPRVQFIVTTHSPMLINGLLKEQIYLIDTLENGDRFISHPEEDAIGLGAEGILREMFNMETTFDEYVVAKSEEYKKLLQKKEATTLNTAEENRFKELSAELSRFRLDPALDIGVVDTIGEIVKEKMGLESKSILKRSGFHKNDSEDLQLRVNNILDELFKSE